MASDTHLHRRVTRLENETESIYDLITEVRSTQLDHAGRLDEIRSTLGDHAGRLDEIRSTLGEVVRRLPDAP
jgi:hypothetical protein